MGVELIVVGAGILGLILLANVLAKRNRPSEVLGFHVALFLINAPLLLVGLLLMVAPGDLYVDALGEFGISVAGVRAVGLILVLMAAWAMLAVLGPVRRLMARVIPLNPESPVHSLALVFAGYLVGQGALALSQGGISGLAQMAQPTSVSYLVLSEMLFAIVGFLGAGYLVRRNAREMLTRMGLQRPTLAHLLVAAVVIPALVIAQAAAGAAWALLNPDQVEILESLNNTLLQDMDTIWEWLLLALAAGLGEELLFRGALQPIFGLWLTSALFALVHVQYGFSPIMLFILLLALALGLIRRYTNTTVAIIVHVGYDFTLGLLALLASYLQGVFGT